MEIHASQGHLSFVINRGYICIRNLRGAHIWTPFDLPAHDLPPFFSAGGGAFSISFLVLFSWRGVKSENNSCLGAKEQNSPRSCLTRVCAAWIAGKLPIKIPPPIRCVSLVAPMLVGGGCCQTQRLGLRLAAARFVNDLMPSGFRFGYFVAVF
ncbi:hypothetical protein CEXT_728241 [Caerostris extrusa]|uniref:Uncharacterized protein n=1 Tax=Caerostris extrusa TaxID=172846 RepID=A0AAV4PC56_CAEEX|nr:hypothetical protein CEXT_728241 [Caerostris extrusa]